MYPPLRGRGLLAAAVGAVAAQLEGVALGGAALAHVLLRAAYRDLLQGAKTGAAGVKSAGVDRTLNAGVAADIPFHKNSSLFYPRFEGTALVWLAGEKTYLPGMGKDRLGRRIE